MSAAVDAFKGSLVYETQQPVEAVLADLNDIAAWDKEVTAKGKLYNKVTIGTLIFGFAGLLLTFIVNPLFLLLFGAGALGLIVVRVFKSRTANFETTRNRYELLAAILRTVSRDMQPTEPVNLRLVLSPANAKPKLTTSETVDGWKCKYFADPWLALKGKLVDGTGYQIGLEEKLRERRKRKYGRSGKAKGMKLKSKSTTLASAQLRPKRTQLAVLTTLSTPDNLSLSLPGTATVKRFDLKAGLPTALVRVSGPLTYHPSDPTLETDGHEVVVRMLLGLYKLVLDARPLVRK